MGEGVVSGSSCWVVVTCCERFLTGMYKQAIATDVQNQYAPLC